VHMFGTATPSEEPPSGVSATGGRKITADRHSTGDFEKMRKAYKEVKDVEAALQSGDQADLAAVASASLIGDQPMEAASASVASGVSATATAAAAVPDPRGQRRERDPASSGSAPTAQRPRRSDTTSDWWSASSTWETQGWGGRASDWSSSTWRSTTPHEPSTRERRPGGSPGAPRPSGGGGSTSHGSGWRPQLPEREQCSRCWGWFNSGGRCPYCRR
jgi:hypothetical protein